MYENEDFFILHLLHGLFDLLSAEKLCDACSIHIGKLRLLRNLIYIPKIVPIADRQHRSC